MSGDAFAAMRAALVDDANLGVDAVFTAKEGGAPVAVRVVPSRPEQTFGGPGFGAPPIAGVVAAAMLPAASIPGRPQNGDRLAFSGLSYQVAHVEQDSRSTSYRLLLKQIPA